MARYYDEMSRDCEGCWWLREEAYEDGRPYVACRFFGYIIHTEKGVWDEPCRMRLTKEQGEAREAEARRREEERQKAKKRKKR